MHKLASLSIGAEVLLVVLVAGFSHEFFRHVGLFNQFMFSMSVRALIIPFAPALKFPVIAHLCFLLSFIFLDVLFTFRLSFELLMTFLWTVAIVGVIGAIGSKVFTVTSIKLPEVRYRLKLIAAIMVVAGGLQHSSLGRIKFEGFFYLANRIRKESSLGSKVLTLKKYSKMTKARCIELVSGVRLKEVRVI
jgi:hypothetical protein